MDGDGDDGSHTGTHGNPPTPVAPLQQQQGQQQQQTMAPWRTGGNASAPRHALRQRVDNDLARAMAAMVVTEPAAAPGNGTAGTRYAGEPFGLPGAQQQLPPAMPAETGVDWRDAAIAEIEDRVHDDWRDAALAAIEDRVDDDLAPGEAAAATHEPEPRTPQFGAVTYATVPNFGPYEFTPEHPWHGPGCVCGPADVAATYEAQRSARFWTDLGRAVPTSPVQRPLQQHFEQQQQQEQQQRPVRAGMYGRTTADIADAEAEAASFREWMQTRSAARARGELPEAVPQSCQRPWDPEVYPSGSPLGEGTCTCHFCRCGRCSKSARDCTCAWKRRSAPAGAPPGNPAPETPPRSSMARVKELCRVRRELRLALTNGEPEPAPRAAPVRLAKRKQEDAGSSQQKKPKDDQQQQFPQQQQPDQDGSTTSYTHQ